jgi:hypothetical protein
MNGHVRPLKKATALARLRELKNVAEGEELAKIHALAVIDTLLEYIHDPDFRDAVDEIPL